MIAKTCTRCGEARECRDYGGIALCDGCTVLIVQEWWVHKSDFAQLSGQEL